MNDQTKHYKYYERIMKMGLEETVFTTAEYQSFSKLFPYIAETIKLEKKIERMTNMLKSEEHKGLEFKIKREITVTKLKLKKNNLHKRLHSESKHETFFRIKFKQNSLKMRYLLLTKKSRTFLGQPVRKFQRKLRKFMHKNLPPSLFNLRELTVAEKGLALREWLQEKHNDSR